MTGSYEGSQKCQMWGKMGNFGRNPQKVAKRAARMTPFFGHHWGPKRGILSKRGVPCWQKCTHFLDIPQPHLPDLQPTVCQGRPGPTKMGVDHRCPASQFLGRTPGGGVGLGGCPRRHFLCIFGTKCDEVRGVVRTKCQSFLWTPKSTYHGPQAPPPRVLKKETPSVGA